MTLRKLATWLVIVAGAIGVAASPTPAHAVTVLLVTDGNGTLTSNESAYKSYLESLGYTVPTVWDNASQATINAAWAAAQVVYVPYSVTDWELADKLRLCTKGIVCEERYLDDNFGLSNTAGWDTTSYTAISITNNSHYITSPFSTGSLTLFTSAQPMTLMNPTHAAGLQTLAEQNFGNKALAIVDVGATLANTVSGNSTALGRRVHLPWGGDSFNIAALNANAQAIGLRAIEWAINDDRLLHLKLNEASGTTAADSSLYARNGTVVGTATWTAGRRHNGFDCNGSTKIEVNSLLGNPTDFTLACWVRIDATDASGVDAVSVGDYLVLRAHNNATGGPQGSFYAGGSTWRTVGFAKNFVGRGWHHYAVTFNSATDSLTLYVDGVNVATTTTTSTISWSGLGTKTCVGANGNASTSFDLDGAVDDVRVYRTALTASEIADVYGLIGQWKLTETSGTTATDSTGKALNGAYTNGPTVAQAGPYPGVGQYATTFDGVNDYVDGASASTNYASMPDGFSVAAWVRLGAHVNNAAVLENGATTESCSLAFSSTGQVRVNGRSSGGLQTLTTTATVPIGVWKHVVGTHDGSTFRVYIDGVLVSTSTNAFTLTTPSGNLTLAASLQGTDEFLNGRLHDVRLYDRAIAADEAAELYGLIGRWSLNETSGTAAADASGVGNSGTYANSPTLGQTGPYPGAGQYSPLLDGVNDHVVVGAVTHGLSAGFTISAWARPTGIASWQRLLDFGNGADVDNIYFGRDNATNDLRIAVKDGSSGNTQIVATGVLDSNLWHHYVATCDSSGNGAIYRDGQVVATGALGTPGDVARTINYIGRSNWSGDAYYQGSLQDVRLYNRPLSTAEVAQVYGLVGHWKLNEGSGTIVADSSGAGAGAAFNGGSPDWISGVYSNALDFNGTTDDTITSSPFAPPTVGTVAFWMRANGTPAATQRLLGLGGDWEIRHATDGKLHIDLCGDGTTGNMISLASPTTSGSWYHIAAMYDTANESYALYINGVLDRGGTSSVALNAQAAAQLSLGTRTGSTERFSGGLDDVRVYSRKLSAWEVYQVYGLMAWYKLDETSGAASVDSTGRGQDGTYSGSPTLNVAANGNATQGTAVAFNGANYMQATGLYDKSSSVSAAAWVRLDGVDSTGAEVVSLGDCFVLRLHSGSNGASARYYNGSTYVTVTASQTTLNAGWHHFVAVLDGGSTLKLYIDGVEAASAATSGAISYTGQGSNTRLASHGNGGTTLDLTGRIDDVRVFNRAMKPAEIAAIYQGTKPAGVRILSWVEAR